MPERFPSTRPIPKTGKETISWRPLFPTARLTTPKRARLVSDPGTDRLFVQHQPLRPAARGARRFAPEQHAGNRGALPGPAEFGFARRVGRPSRRRSGGYLGRQWHCRHHVAPGLVYVQERRVTIVGPTFGEYANVAELMGAPVEHVSHPGWTATARSIIPRRRRSAIR